MMPLDAYAWTAEPDTGIESRKPSAPVKKGSDGWFLGVTVGVTLCALLIGVAGIDAAADAARLGVFSQIALILLGMIIARSFVGPIHPLSAIAFVTYSQIVLFVARPVYQMLYADALSAFSGQTYGAAFVQAQAIAGLGYVSICVGYGWALRRARDTFPLAGVRPWLPSEYRRFRPAIVFVVLAGMGLYGVYVLQTGVGAYLSGVLAGRSEEARASVSGSSAYFYSGLQFALGALVLLLLQYRFVRNRIGQIWAIVLLALAVLPQLLAGNRSVFIPVAVAVLIILSSTNPRVISLGRVALVLPIAFILGIVAPRIWRDGLSRGGTIEEAIQSALSIESAIGDFVGGLDTAMIDAFEMQVAAQNNGTLDLRFGETYLHALAAVIPRQMWPDKPEAVDVFLNSALFPATHDLGIGFAFGVYSEPYLNFGPVGVILVCLVFGAVLGRATRWVSGAPTVMPAFWLIMLTAYIFPLMRGSLTFDAQRLFMPVVPVLIAVAVATILDRRHRSHINVASPATPRPPSIFGSDTSSRKHP